MARTELDSCTQERVLSDLEHGAADRAARYWPTWPPREHDLHVEQRVETALKWGRHAAYHALADVRRTAREAREYLPSEPYANVHIEAGIPFSLRYLHLAHETTLRGVDETDEVDLFGE